MAVNASSYKLNENEDVVLYFSYPSAGNSYISAVYSKGSFFLPLSELFSLLDLHYEIDTSLNLIKGTWHMPSQRWKIDINSLHAVNGKNKIFFSNEDIRFGRYGLYLSSGVYERIFGLRFMVEMSTLKVTLEYDKLLPVDERQSRKVIHSEIERMRDDKNIYPHNYHYPRQRKLFKTGVLDYNLGMLSENATCLFNYYLKGGGEVLGGDLEVLMSGGSSKELIALKTVRPVWKYAFKRNSFLQSLKAGHFYSGGIIDGNMTGIAISNDPVVPRRYCNNHVVEGHTDPGSEVELYLNNRLSSFVFADDRGHYRFDVPLRYGSERIKVIVYTPKGEIIQKRRKIMTPHDFLPEDVVSYNAEAGILQSGFSASHRKNHLVRGDIGWGVSKNITARSGIDYYSGGEGYVLYSALYTRIFRQYLMNIYFAPEYRYNTGLSADYPSGYSWGINYTRFYDMKIPACHIFKSEADAHIFLPFYTGCFTSGFRISYKHTQLNNGTMEDIRTGVNVRSGRFRFRFDYRGFKNSNYSAGDYIYGLADISATYTFPRLRYLPSVFRGGLMNGRVELGPCGDIVNTVGIKYSGSIGNNGRLSLNMSYSPLSGSAYLFAGINICLSDFRIVSGYTRNEKGYSYRQNIYGSVRKDPLTGKVLFSNREQVGYAGVSVIMFVDSNDNGIYDSREEIIPSKAIRLNQSAEMKLSAEGVLNINRLISYQTYNAEIVQAELPDPVLAPAFTGFSFTADPNRHKLIKIPLYQTGVIEGIVTSQQGGERLSTAGLRILMTGPDDSSEETLLTYSDGAFYSMGLLPGSYEIEVDPVQLECLNACCNPKKIKFEIDAVSEGDLCDSLIFVLFPHKISISKKNP